jgi:hypothetical protein
MVEEPQNPLNTREFVALWNVAKEEVLVQRVTAALARLARGGALPPLTEAQSGMLAHAIQLAGDSAAGPLVALQYLETLTGGESSGSSPGA